MLDRIVLSLLLVCSHWMGVSLQDSASIHFPLLSISLFEEKRASDFIVQTFEPLLSDLNQTATDVLPLAVVEPQQQRPSVLPWIWLASAAVVGTGISAYVLKSHDAGQTEHSHRNVVGLPSRASAVTSSQRTAALSSVVTVSSLAVRHQPSKGISVRNVSCDTLTRSSILAKAASSGHSLQVNRSIEYLLNNLESRDRAIRRQAIWELGQLGAPIAVQPLVDSMVNSDSQQRSLILAALSEIGVRTLTPMNQALMLSLQDKNADVRKNAIRDITRLYRAMEHINQILAQAIADEDPEVRATAEWALNQVHPPSAQSLSVLPTTVVHHPHV
ncbi:MAG: HEAT repeat domain-containing protein [Cyanobacteria bacterium P01_F01_bin.150]